VVSNLIAFQNIYFEKMKMIKQFLFFTITGIVSWTYANDFPLYFNYVNTNIYKEKNCIQYYKPIPASPLPNISIYYVSPAGEDKQGNGTFGKPFKTLAYAAAVVPSNKAVTIKLSKGIFVETKPAMIPPGVNIIGAGQDVTILSSSGVAYPDGVEENKLWYDGSLIQLVSPHNTIFRNPESEVIAPVDGNQEISGFTIDGNNKKLKAGVWVENRNSVSMHHVTFKNISQRGAVFSPGDKPLFTYPKYYMKNIKAWDCIFINSGKDLSDETLGNLCIAQLDGASIYNIHIKDDEGYGIKFIHDGYYINTIIHDCTIDLNETDSKWGEDVAIEMWNIGPGNKIYNITCNTWLSIVNHEGMFPKPEETANMKVHDVRMIDKDGISNKESIEIAAPGVEVYNSYFENKGIGIAIWDMGRENILIRNNIFHNSMIHNNWAGGAAVYIDNSRNWDFKNIAVCNNIFDLINYGVKIKGNRVLVVNIKNNIFLGTAISDVESSALHTNFNNNLKFNGKSDDWVLAGVQSEKNNIITNPGFLQTGKRWGNYYKAATANAAMLDKGIDVGIPFKGLAPDIGRWEF
jgi:hypothetical protein